MDTLKTGDFDFALPPELTPEPLEKRDGSRLLSSISGGEDAHKHFFDLPGLLNPGDCLISRFARPPARSSPRRDTGGEAELSAPA
jgi:S-adenosylmethionine:tRNA ribosyltransferase-isomerase